MELVLSLAGRFVQVVMSYREHVRRGVSVTLMLLYREKPTEGDEREKDSKLLERNSLTKESV